MTIARMLGKTLDEMKGMSKAEHILWMAYLKEEQRLIQEDAKRRARKQKGQ